MTEQTTQLKRSPRSDVIALWGGIGRTGTVIGCYLAQHGLVGERALAEIARLRQDTPRGATPLPFRQVQRQVVLSWPATNGKRRTLFKICDTPVKAEPAVLLNLVVIWGTMSWLAARQRPQRSWPARFAVGALSTATLMTPDIAHIFGHIVSARLAGAGMDEVALVPGMPRTVYFNDDVAASVHRTRALGGPLASGVSLLVSLLLRQLTPPDSLAREQMDWACLGHGFIFVGSLLPLPMVDGGTVLKWTLVERGHTPDQADTVVQRVDLGLGVAALLTGLGLAARRRWWPALGGIAGGLFAIGAALGKIR